MMRPFGGHTLSVKQRVFNYRLSRAKRYIECAFGILANMWRIFHRPLDVDIRLAEKIVGACVAFHNFVRQRDVMNFEEKLHGSPLDDLQAGQNIHFHSYRRQPRHLRNIFADYFVGTGNCFKLRSFAIVFKDFILL
jgi:hypothetical protein